MISSIFSIITEAITSFATALGTALSGVQSLFVTVTGTGSSATYDFTMLGTLTILSAGIGIVFLVIYWIRRLCSIGVK